MIEKKRVLFSVLIGLVTEAINKVSPLLILHFAQARLGVERFGYAQFGMTLTDLAIPFIIFGYNTIGSIEVGRNKGDPIRVGQIMAEISTLKIGHALLAFVTLFSMTQFIPAYAQYENLVIALSFVLLFAALELHYVHLGMQRIALFSVFTGGAKIVSLVLIFALVNDPDDALLYAVLSTGANSLVNGLTLFYGWRVFPFKKPTIEGMRLILRKSLPFAFVFIVFAWTDKFDMFLVNAFFGNVGSGLYAGPARIAQSLYSAVMAIAIVFFSELVVIKEKQTFSQYFNLGCWSVFMFLLPITFGIWFVDQRILELVMGSGFAEVGQILSILVVGIFAHALMSTFGYQVLMLQEKQKSMARSLIVGAVFGLAIALPLANRFNLTGIAIATVLAKTCAAILMIFAAKPHLERLPWREFISAFVPSAIMAGALYVLESSDLVMNISVGAVVFALASMPFNWSFIKAAQQNLKRKN